MVFCHFNSVNEFRYSLISKYTKGSQAHFSKKFSFSFLFKSFFIMKMFSYGNIEQMYDIAHEETFFFFLLFRAAHVAYGGSQTRGPIGATATGLCQNHSNVGSEPHLQPTPQLMATPDP